MSDGKVTVLPGPTAPDTSRAYTAGVPVDTADGSYGGVVEVRSGLATRPQLSVAVVNQDGSQGHATQRLSADELDEVAVACKLAAAHHRAVARERGVVA